MYEAKVVVLCPEMGGGYDTRPGAEDIWIETYPTRKEADLFVQYWKSVSDSYENVPENGLRFITGSVKEID